jgi:hypothetical protein
MKRHRPMPIRSSSSEPEVNLNAVTDADWERLCRLINLPSEAREELETIITGYQTHRSGAPPIPSKLISSLRKVAGDAQRLAGSLGELSGDAELIINMTREKAAVENWNLGLLKAVVGTGEFPTFDLGLNTRGFTSSKGSGFLTEIREKVTGLAEYAAAGAAAKISLESETVLTFAFIVAIDKLLFKHLQKRVQRPSEKGIVKEGSTYRFICAVCELAGIRSGIDDAIKAVIKASSAGRGRFARRRPPK